MSRSHAADPVADELRDKKSAPHFCGAFGFEMPQTYLLVFGSFKVLPVGLLELESVAGPDGGTAEGLVDDGDFIVSEPDGPEGPAGPVGGVAGVIAGLVVEDVEAPG